MRGWSAADVAAAAGATLARAETGAGGPARVVIDSRAAGPGDLFAGLRGENVDGGAFAPRRARRRRLGRARRRPSTRGAALAAQGGAVLVADDPLAALGSLATGWRRRLGARVVGITGSTGKTSTKDLLAGDARDRTCSVVATEQNLNTEIGLPLTVLGAPDGTRRWCSRWRCAAAGQIAELALIAEPDVGVIVNVGPVHLELLGSDRGRRARQGRADRASCARARRRSLPADEPLLGPIMRADVETVTFGPGGDVDALPEGLELPFASAHMRRNALAALAAARALGVEPRGGSRSSCRECAGSGSSSPGGIVVVDDCYNANPMSMRAALDDLAETAAGRRVAVLGDMRELGPDERRYHAELGAWARDAGVDVLVTVGELAGHAAAGYGARAACTPCPTPRRRRSSSRSCSSPATRCSSRPRAASGSRP